MPVERMTCVLTDEERDARARNASALLGQLGELEEQKRTAMADYTERLKALREEIGTCAKAARTGVEEREVQVTPRPNNERLVVEYWRDDTGEKARERPMTDDEMRVARQAVLPLRESPAIPQAAAPLRGEASVTPIRGAKP